MIKLRTDKYMSTKTNTIKIEKFIGLDALSDEIDMPPNCARYGYNIKISNGMISTGDGIGYASIGGKLIPSTLPQAIGIRKIFLFKKVNRVTGANADELIILSDNAHIYKNNMTTDTVFYDTGIVMGSTNVTFLNCIYNDQDYLFACDDIGNAVMYNGSTYTTRSSLPYFSDVCVYNDRLYAVTDKGSNALKYSASFNPTEWTTGAGEVDFHDGSGKINHIVPFKESLMIFRQNAVYKYTAYKGSSTYTLSKVFETDDIIFSDTVASGHGKMFFVTSSGFIQYDGSSFSKVKRGLFPIITSLENAKGCFFKGKYILACKMDNNGESIGEETVSAKNNALISFYPESEDVSIFRGADIVNFLPVDKEEESQLFLQFRFSSHPYDIGMLTENGKLFLTNLKKCWKSPRCSLGVVRERKILRKIFLRCGMNATLKVNTDVEDEYQLSSSNRVQLLFVNKKADAVGLTLTSTADGFLLSSMEIEFDTVERSIYDR